MKLSLDCGDLVDTQGTGVKQVKLLPDGEWLKFIVEEVRTEKKDGSQILSKNGDPMAFATCKVVGTEHDGTEATKTICFMDKEKDGAGIAVHFIHSLGLKARGLVNVDTDEWVGKMFKGLVKHYKKGDQTTNSIDQVMPLEDTPEVVEDDPFETRV